MMLSRRWPKATRSCMNAPPASGPRGCIRPVMAAMQRPAASPLKVTSPQMPHIVLLVRNECPTRTPVRRRIHQRLRGWAGSADTAGCDSARQCRNRLEKRRQTRLLKAGDRIRAKMLPKGAAMGVRDGKSYISRLKAHPRDVWVAGRKVGDVTDDPVFRRPVAAMARLYDCQSDAELHSTMTYLPDDGDEPAGVSFIIPRTHADLVHRRKAMRVWADATFGTMGRSPDFLNTVLASMADAPEFFAEVRRQIRRQRAALLSLLPRQRSVSHPHAGQSAGRPQQIRLAAGRRIRLSGHRRRNP